MNAQLLAALGEQVQKAIAAAVDPLLARIKELEARELPPAYDDTAMKIQLENFVAKQALDVEAILGRIKDARYDDSDLRDELEKLLAQQVAAAESRTKMLDIEASLLSRIKAIEDRDAPADGRDAMQLEILPAIDEAKSYTRGTYAKHAGGLWRAYEQTHAMRGWECIVDGVAAVYPSIEGKSFKMTVRSSSGCERYAEAMIPVQVYKGVWSEGDYLSGDTVTWAGSLWHCNKDGTSTKPGDGSGDWTLAVKKGRDANQTVSIK